MNLYEYDAGVEFNLVRPLSSERDLKPFLGVGAGARTYDYAAATLRTRTCFAAYAAAGTEFQYRAAAIRLEARDFGFCYRDPILDDSETRNEPGLSIGFAYHVGRY